MKTKERPQLEAGETLEKWMESSFGGIKKVLYWSGVTAFVSVEDNVGPNFVVSVPQPGFEDKGPKWHFDHAMLFGPLISARGNIYSAPEGV